MQTGNQALEGDSSGRQDDAQSCCQLSRFPLAAYSCDALGLITGFNHGAVELWQRTPQLKSPADRYCGSYRLRLPNGTPIRHEECWTALALREGRGYHDRRIVIERPDGSCRLVRTYATPFHDAAGRLAGVTAAFVEIADVPQPARAREWDSPACDASVWFASFMQHLPAAAWIKDPDGRYVYANEHAQMIFGVSLDQIQGKTDWEIFPAETARQFRKNDQRAFQIKAAVRTIEQLRHDDDIVHESMVTKFPILDASGDVALIGGVAIDVTEYRQTVKELGKSEAKLQTLLDNTRACVFAKDLEGRYILANKSVVRLFGWPDASYGLGKTDYELHPRERADIFVVNDRQVLQSGTPVEVEEQIDQPDGRRIFLVLKFPLRDAEHRVYAVCGIASDITERKRAEEALRISEERYRSLAELMPVGVYTCEAPSGVITYFNKQAARLWGRVPRAGDAEERFCAAFRIWRQDGSYLPHDETPMADAVREGRAFRNESVVLERSDGTRINVMVNIDPVRDAEGRIVGAINAFHDATALNQAHQALRESEQHFRSLANITPAIIWTASPDGTVTWASDRWFEYTGLSPHARATEWAQVVHPDDFERCIQQWRNAVRDGSEYEVEMRNRRFDGEYRWFLTRATPIRAADGRIVTWYGSTTDIDDRKRAEEVLREADRRKDEFLAMLAHELRNPLAPIRAGLDLMKLAADDPATMAATRETMERQTQQLITLVDDLLEVSRITRGKLQLRKCRVNIADIVQSAVEATKPMIEEAGHRLTVRLPSEPLIVDADPNRMAQVLSNLLNNAAKYTPDEGQIWLTAKRTERQVTVSVRDSGAGIPADMIDSIFEMFTQIRRPDEGGQSGLGIGLTLVKLLVNMHGGTVDVSSDGLGRGSTFTVRLPLCDEFPGEPPASSTKRPVEATRRNFSSGAAYRVLVVDDNKAAADTLSMLVKMLGHTVQTANDGCEAIEAAAKFRPALVLMDLGMPNMNGYEAAQFIRQQTWGKQMKLVALTGWGQDDDKRRTKEAGFDHHLVKPAEIHELQRLLWGLEPDR